MRSWSATDTFDMMRPLRDPAARFVLTSAAITGVVTGGALMLGATAPSVSAPPVPEPPPAAVTCPGAEGDPSLLRACLADSVVLLSGPAGSLGTGIVLDDGAIVTNAHVVGFADAVDVTFVDGERIEGVAVVGADVTDDIALLGVPDAERSGVHLEPLPDQNEIDDAELFLVGFPGAVEGEEPAIGLSRGILSRLRPYDEFAQTIVQSDAVIAGGQSGGALIDRNGRVLGLSGYYAFGFSYSLSSDDVIEAIERIRSGDGAAPVRLPEPTDDDEVSQTVRVADSYAQRRLMVPAADGERTLTIDIRNPEFSVQVTTGSGILLGSYDQYPTGEWGDPADLDHPDEWYSEVGSPYRQRTLVPDDDGVLAVEVPAGEPVFVQYSPYGQRASRVTMSEPFVVLDVVASGDPIGIGETVSGSVDMLTGQTEHDLALDAGDEITVRYQGSPVTPDLTIMSPDDAVGAAGGGFGYFAQLDLTGLGFLDQEVVRTYEINRTGTFRLVFSSSLAADYVVSVERTG